ncbi:MAG: ATP-binding protein [Firmicutes bacterium]|nr:ATP-binding protein [Bacillota bacterium]
MRIKIDNPALRAIPGIIDRICDFAQETISHPDTDKLGECKMILDELLTNIISYGFTGRTDGWVQAEASVKDGALYVTLTDNGILFDPLAWDSRPEDFDEEGGLGIHLARQMSDDMTYKVDQGYNQLRIVKVIC